MHECFVKKSPTRWNIDKPANRQRGEDAFGIHPDGPRSAKNSWRFQDVEALARRIEVAIAVAA